MLTLPSLLTAVETLIHTAMPWHCPWMKRRLRDVIVAILVGQTVVIRSLADTLHTIHPAASAASHERRLRRMTEDDQLNWTIYATILPWVLRVARGVRVTIILDETSHTDQWSVLTAAMDYHGRAIPLAWMIWRGQTKRETGYWDATKMLLKQVRTIIPRTTPVVGVADRAFGCPIFIDQVVTMGWDMVVRVQGQSRVRSARVPEQPIRDLGARGTTRSFSGEVFKGAGWRSMRILATWDTRCRESLLLVSTLRDDLTIRTVYQHRFAIECMFRDWKSAGLAWEANQCQTEASAALVVLGLALSTVMILCLRTDEATELLQQEPQRGKRRPWDARDSVFRLGYSACDAGSCVGRQ